MEKRLHRDWWYYCILDIVNYYDGYLKLCCRSLLIILKVGRWWGQRRFLDRCGRSGRRRRRTRLITRRRSRNWRGGCCGWEQLGVNILLADRRWPLTPDALATAGAGRRRRCKADSTQPAVWLTARLPVSVHLYAAKVSWRGETFRMFCKEKVKYTYILLTYVIQRNISITYLLICDYLNF